jgi:hypothetical protein
LSPKEPDVNYVPLTKLNLGHIQGVHSARLSCVLTKRMCKITCWD